MMNKFLYDGKMSDDFGIYISGSGTYNAPERDVGTVTIPGRNGDLLIDNRRFKNITVEYPAFIREKFREKSGVARMWLTGSAQYRRLEDSCNPQYYRMARFSGPLDFDTRFLNRGGECKILFDCKPQRYLKSGEYARRTSGHIDLFNPTGMTALPLIRVSGTGDGELVVGNTVVTISGMEGFLYIDSDTQNAYRETQNCNSKISQIFPVLPAGKTGISFSGDIAGIEIIPRWWTL